MRSAVVYSGRILLLALVLAAAMAADAASAEPWRNAAAVDHRFRVTPSVLSKRNVPIPPQIYEQLAPRATLEVVANEEEPRLLLDVALLPRACELGGSDDAIGGAGIPTQLALRRDGRFTRGQMVVPISGRPQKGVVAPFRKEWKKDDIVALQANAGCKNVVARVVATAAQSSEAAMAALFPALSAVGAAGNNDAGDGDVGTDERFARLAPCESVGAEEEPEFCALLTEGFDGGGKDAWLAALERGKSEGVESSGAAADARGGCDGCDGEARDTATCALDRSGGEAGCSGQPFETSRTATWKPKVGTVTTGDRLTMVMAALHFPKYLVDALDGRIVEVTNPDLAAGNKHASEQMLRDLAAYRKRLERQTAAQALMGFDDLTGTATLYWLDKAAEAGAAAHEQPLVDPIIILLLLPGSLLKQHFAAECAAVETEQAAMLRGDALKAQPRGSSKDSGAPLLMGGYRCVTTHAEAVLPMYAHTARSPELREAVGRYGTAFAALMKRALPSIVELARSHMSCNPFVLSSEAPWSLVATGTNYHTLQHADLDDLGLTHVFYSFMADAQGMGLTPEEAKEAFVVTMFIASGISAFKRDEPWDVLLFCGPRVWHGADFLPAAEVEKLRASGGCEAVTVASGVVTRRSDAQAGKLVARGMVEGMVKRANAEKDGEVEAVTPLPKRWKLQEQGAQSERRCGVDVPLQPSEKRAAKEAERLSAGRSCGK